MSFRSISSPRFSPASCRQQGVAAVEFAILVFLLLLVGAGLVEFGRGLWYYDALAKGTRDAARYLSAVPVASLDGETATAQAIVVEAAAAALIPGFGNEFVIISCAPKACAVASLPSEVDEVRVSVEYPLVLGDFFPFIPSGRHGPQGISYAITLRPHTAMPYLW